VEGVHPALTVVSAIAVGILAQALASHTRLPSIVLLLASGAALGPDGIVVNIGRGSVIDEPALIEALASRTIYAAGLDVFANEPHVPKALLELDNAVLLPHLGSASVYTRDAMGQLMIDNLTGWFETRTPLTPVPETPVPHAN